MDIAIAERKIDEARALLRALAQLAPKVRAGGVGEGKKVVRFSLNLTFQREFSTDSFIGRASF